MVSRFWALFFAGFRVYVLGFSDEALVKPVLDPHEGLVEP